MMSPRFKDLLMHRTYLAPTFLIFEIKLIITANMHFK